MILKCKLSVLLPFGVAVKERQSESSYFSIVDSIYVDYGNNLKPAGLQFPPPSFSSFVSAECARNTFRQDCEHDRESTGKCAYMINLTFRRI